MATSSPDAAATASAPRVGRLRAMGATPRALLLGLLFTALVDFWIHYAELVMGGGQGHTALAASAVPVGAFSVLFVLSGVNVLCRYVLPGLALSGAELLVVYSMITTSSVLSSSGQLHFLIPTVAAGWHYATADNAWAGTFHRFVPRWMGQQDPTALEGFYKGKTVPPWHLWAPQMGAWIGFLLALSFATLCIAALLRRQWVDRERLAFPTVALPVALMEQEERVPLFRQPLFWLGAAVPFAFSVMNTAALNAPSVPLVSLRDDRNLADQIGMAPWNALNPLKVSFYPFIVGIAYLIPVDVTFSAWFFYLVTKAEAVFGAALNIDANMTASTKATFPFLGQQGAGAFLALTVVSLWLSRGYLREVLKTIFREPGGIDDSDEPIPYRWAALGLLVSCAFLVGFCVAGGMQPIPALLLVVLTLAYMIAAARIRAETGNAWLWGPEVDVNTLMTRTFGTGLLTPQDMTVMAYTRSVFGNADMRCMAMPHQFDAFKMADSVGASRRRLFGAICVGTVFGLTASFCIALTVWHHFGAEAKTDAWRTFQGRVPFDSLVAMLRNPVAPDWRGVGAVAFGFAVTAALMLLRTYFVWWPLHPIGYALANTNTMSSTWVPFLLAWLVKSLVLRYGGARMYRQLLPFFLGLIAGDLLGGGLTTLIGAFTGINVYPINW
jgi:hypothetical protein